MKYKIIHKICSWSALDEVIEDVEFGVSQELNYGWQLVGGVSICHYPDRDLFVVSQALCRAQYVS